MSNNSSSNARLPPPIPIFVGKTTSKNDAKALGFIKRALSPAILQRIIHAAKAKEAWDILKREFGNPKVPPPTPMRRKPHRHHIHRPAPAGSKRAKALSALSSLSHDVSIIGRTVHDAIRKHHGSSQQSPFDGVTSDLHVHDGMGSSTDHHLNHFQDYGNSDLLFMHAATGVGSTIDPSSQIQDCGGNDLFAYAHDDMGSSTSDNLNQIQDCYSNALFAYAHDDMGSSTFDNLNQIQDCDSNALFAYAHDGIGCTNDQCEVDAYYGMGSSTDDHCDRFQDYVNNDSFVDDDDDDDDDDTYGSHIDSICSGIMDMF
ncbi:hypothetical protein LIER_08259 [Lithospermum erythrorhizon]|uniref:Uncharacterized protein n=1 Tax=Lithospermum erythrorhizon TaxID=34254 RepID=A0AAV3PDA3_LITER